MSSPFWVRAGAVSLAVAGSMCVGSTAHAAEAPSEPVHGIALEPGGKTYAESDAALADKPLNDTRIELYKAYDEFGTTARGAARDKIAARILNLEARADSLAGGDLSTSKDKWARPAGLPESSISSPTVVAAAVPTSKTLQFTHSSQSNGYYCGPASTAMSLRSMGASETSAWDSSHTMSQSRLASDQYLQTTTNGTPIDRIRVTLKKWAGVVAATNTGFDRPALKSLVRQELGGSGKAPVYGTRENSGGAHYNGHPSSVTIDHFIEGYGYYNSGDNLRYGDPATSQYGAASSTNTMTTASMATFIAPWGVVA